jgi:hypothetical protein
MKITASQLRQLITESLDEVMAEQSAEMEMDEMDVDSEDGEESDEEMDFSMDDADDDSGEEMDMGDDMDSDDEMGEGEDEGPQMNSKEEVAQVLNDVAQVVQAAAAALASLGEEQGVSESVAMEMREAFSRVSNAQKLVENSIKKDRNKSVSILRDLRKVTSKR